MTRPKKNAFDPGSFLVAEKRCAQCLYTKNRIVSEDRAAQLIAECKESGSYFVCHKGSLTGNDQLCCNGYYEDAKDTAKVILLARALHVVKFIPVPKTN